jgi:hypothetical protein
VITAIVLGIVVSAVVIVALAYHISRKSGKGGAHSFIINVSPRSLSIVRGGSGSWTVTFSPIEYGSRISPSMIIEAEEFGEIDGFSSPISQNSFAYNFEIENNVPLGTYTVTLSVVTYVPSPPLTASENLTLTIT